VEGREEQVEDEIGYLSPQDILEFCAQRFPFLEQFKGCYILFYIEQIIISCSLTSSTMV